MAARIRRGGGPIAARLPRVSSGPQPGEIRAHLASIGDADSSYDVLIAGQSKARKLTLVTHNTTEFQRVPSLKVEDWKGATPRLLQDRASDSFDVDTTRHDPSQPSPCLHHPASGRQLNRLLNELDGLRERADVFFILTTNRPDTLEPALASRPGRIDQAIEFPLPDERLRRLLVALYARSLELSLELMDDLAHRTDGASPAFIKEFLRRIAQHHLDSDMQGNVTKATAEAALHEMLFSGGALNTRLLGGKQ